MDSREQKDKREHTILLIMILNNNKKLKCVNSREQKIKRERSEQLFLNNCYSTTKQMINSC